MALLRLNGISISFGDNPILNKIELAVGDGERTALVGRNGTGKSTLLKIMAKLVNPDEGERVLRQGVTLAYLQQDVPAGISGSIYDVVADGLPEQGQLLRDYHQESLRVAAGEGDDNKLQALQNRIDTVDAWQLQYKVSETLSRMQLDEAEEFSALSGGMKRRVLLARALVTEPDILLLDEPTNHLDIPAIQWIEKYLKSLRCSLVFITHDRSFLRSLANRIIDLDRGNLTDWPGNYEKYLTAKEQMLETEAQHNAAFDKKLAEEEVWIRQGIKARRTRNEGRVRALKQLRETRKQRVNVTGSVNLQANSAGRSGKKVIECESISFGFADELIVKNFSTSIMRGDKIGVIGPNGVGKSTLIKLLLGQLQPSSGSVVTGTNLEIAYFDQLRATLDPQATAMDNVSGGTDMVQVNGEERHIISYMQDFLFAPQRARAPITALSGGETNRLMLAKLFLQPSNVLVLDEPTNDLDIETLELLEALLADYAGTVILISHDREFIDNIVTSTFVFSGHGNINEYVGGYSDWLHQEGNSQDGAQSGSLGNKDSAKSNKALNQAATSKKAPKAKLSYKIQRELDLQPEMIDKLETEITALETRMSEPDFYGSAGDSAKTISRLEAANKELETAFERWEELEKLRDA